MKVERGGFRGRLSAFLQKAMAGAAKKTPAGTDGRGASGVSRAQSGARAAPPRYARPQPRAHTRAMTRETGTPRPTLCPKGGTHDRNRPTPWPCWIHTAAGNLLPRKRGGGRVGARFRASGSGRRSPAKACTRREALPRPLPPSGRGAQRNACRTRPSSRHGANARGNARSAKSSRPPRARMTKHDICGGPHDKNMMRRAA